MELRHPSSESPEWFTPPEIIEATIAVMGSIDLDPCSNSKEEPNVPAALHYTIEDDGLSQPWAGRLFLNPPYGREIGMWVERLENDFEAGTVTEAIALLPARTDTSWFQKLREFPRCFLHGRLRFSGHDTGAPFPSVVFYLGKDCSRFAKVFGERGDVYIRFVSERESDFDSPEENDNESIDPDTCRVCGLSDKVAILPRRGKAGMQYVLQCDRCEKIVRFVPKREAEERMTEQRTCEFEVSN